MKKNKNWFGAFALLTALCMGGGCNNASDASESKSTVPYSDYLVIEAEGDEFVVVSCLWDKVPKDGAIRIPEGVTIIKDSAFWRSYNLTYPGFVKSVICPDSLKKIGKYAFYQNKDLESVTFNNNGKLEEIGTEAFLETNLKNIIIPDGLKVLNPRVFLDSHSNTITIPSSIELILVRALYTGADHLDVTYKGTKAQFKKIMENLTFDIVSDYDKPISPETFSPHSEGTLKIHCTDGIIQTKKVSDTKYEWQD